MISAFFLDIFNFKNGLSLKFLKKIVKSGWKEKRENGDEVGKQRKKERKDIVQKEEWKRKFFGGFFFNYFLYYTKKKRKRIIILSFSSFFQFSEIFIFPLSFFFLSRFSRFSYFLKSPPSLLSLSWNSKPNCLPPFLLKSSPILYLFNVSNCFTPFNMLNH